MLKRNLADLRKKLIASTQRGIKEKYSERDVHIVRAISTLDDLDEIFNLMFEHVREWYSAHFPEIFRIAKEPENSLRLVYELGARENFTFEKIKEFYNNEDKARALETAAKKSVGAETLEQDIAEIKLLALNALNMREEREYLSKYLEKTMAELCPNFSEICGAVLGARILAKAGSLKALAIMPASTIQIIGAEKALFNAKKAGSKRTPKYGYLYQHSLVRTASQDQKGRVARAIAGKLSIAVRSDYFSKNDITKQLKMGLEKRVADISNSKPRKKKKHFEEPRKEDSDFGKRRDFENTPRDFRNKPQNFRPNKAGFGKPNFNKPNSSKPKFRGKPGASFSSKKFPDRKQKGKKKFG